MIAKKHIAAGLRFWLDVGSGHGPETFIIVELKDGNAIFARPGNGKTGLGKGRWWTEGDERSSAR
jgi:hypothetical protein